MMNSLTQKLDPRPMGYSFLRATMMTGSLWAKPTFLAGLVGRVGNSTYIGLALAASIACAEQQAGANDWPQWRGPTRDGIAPAGTKLAEGWPKDGPKLLWKGATIPGLADGGPLGGGYAVGGCGSVTVAAGKAFFFAHCKYKKEKVMLTTQALISLGWIEGLTEELAKRVDKAYKFDLKGQALDNHINQFIATLQPAETEKFGKALRESLAAKWDERYSWGLLYRLSTMRDKEFASIEEWNHKSPGDILHGHGEHAGDIRSLLDANGCEFKDTVFCVDAATGKEAWKSELPGSESVGSNGFGASSTPAIASDKCYVTGSSGVYCLAVKDGAVIWKAKTKFSHSSPLVANGAAYVMLPDGLAAFQADNGQVLWTQPAVKSRTSSAAQWTSGGKNYLLCSSDPKDLVCVEPDKGAVLWRVYCSNSSAPCTPTISGDIAVVFGYCTLAAYRLAPEKATLAWPIKNHGDERGASPLIYNDHIYLVGGDYGPAVTCIDLKTGETKWKQKIGHTEASSPILADDKIIAYIEEHPVKLLMFKATPEKYEELARTPGTREVLCLNASPALTGGSLYLRLKDSIACYDLIAAGNGGEAAAPTPTAGQSVAADSPKSGPTDFRIAAPPAAAAPVTTTAQAEIPGWTKNWPCFRGPAGNGTAATDADPPSRIDLARDVIYSVAVPARGHSSPIVWGKHIFLTGEGDRIMAFERASGKLLWDTAIKSPAPIAMPGDEKLEAIGKDTGLAAPTPCTDGQRVYAFFGTGVLACVDNAGQQVWSQRLIKGKPRNVYGLAACPVLYGDLVIQVVDQGSSPDDRLSFIVALRAKDGVPVWAQERPVRSSWSTPLLHHGPQGDELIATAPPWVIAYQPTTGAELWRAGELNGDVAASPISGKDLLYAPAGQGSSELLAIKPGGKGDVTKSGVAWKADVPSPDAASPVCDGKRYLHITSGSELRCLDSATGKELWNKELAGMFWASPVLAGKRLYAVNTAGELSVLSTADDEVQCKVKLPEKVTASPAILGGCIYLRTAGHLMCIGKQEK